MRSLPRRIRKRWLAAGGGLVLAVALVAPLTGQLGDGWGGGAAVPTVVVEPARFVRRVPADGVLAAVRATPVSLPPTVMQPMRIAWLAEDGSRVAAGEVVVRFDPTDMEKNLIDAQDQLRSAELERERAVVQRDSELVRLEHDARLAGSELANARDFQKKDETIFSRHEIIESEIDQDLAERRMEHSREARQRRERLSDAELELIAIDRRQADAAIGRARQGLAALELTAPHDGLLLLSRVRGGEPVRVGDTVFMGMPIAEIPDLSAMKAEVFVLEADAGGLAVGQPAEVVVEAHPERRFAATVERVDSLAKPRLRGSPVQYFAVTLQLAETVPEVMKPGARLRAWIDLGGVEGALAVPRQAVVARDGGHLVYRRTGGGFEPVPVELGPAAMGRVVVTSGLAAGDVVALVDPTRPLAAADDEEEGEDDEAAGGPALPGAAP